MAQHVPSGITPFCSAACYSFPFRRVFGKCVSGHLGLSTALVAIIASRMSPAQPLMGYVLHGEAHQAENGEVFLGASAGTGHRVHKY